jgi:hypothetical protein
MITSSGIEIISKYLVGQASSYASHIAIGCGARPLSDETGILVASSGSVGTVTSSNGIYSATLTMSDGLNYLDINDVITATSTSSGSLGSGTVTVVSINSPTQITINSTATMTAGSGLTNIKVIGSLKSKKFSEKTNLDFEMARFPITSRSYIVDKQVIQGTSITITAAKQITVAMSLSTVNQFTVGDKVNITDVYVITGSPLYQPQLNGLYVITSVTLTSSVNQFTATPYDSSVSWGSSLWNVAYAGYATNSSLFNITGYTKQISLTAEITDAFRYDITELGLYSLGSNQYTNSDSRILLNFTQTENWQYFDATNKLYSDITYTNSMTSTFTTTIPIFVSSDDNYWKANTYRKIRQEQPRLLGDALILPGALSDYTSPTFTSTSDYINLQNPGVDLSTASSTDELRLAFSLVNAASSVTSTLIDSINIMFEFLSSNGQDYARASFIKSDTSVAYGNRYIVSSLPISSITTTTGFNWKDVSSVKVYCSVEVSGTPTDNFAIAIDGLRYENLTTANPLYALTAYTVVNNSSLNKINKKANTNNLVNFRLDLGIGA